MITADAPARLAAALDEHHRSRSAHEHAPVGAQEQQAGRSS
ncbi:hypothetical protein [Rathayibacter rubneri]|nr:hypothetical protein [Rathayibacter rubneri]